MKRHERDNTVCKLTCFMGLLPEGDFSFLMVTDNESVWCNDMKQSTSSQWKFSLSHCGDQKMSHFVVL